MGRVSTVVFCGNAAIENLGTPKQSINCLGIISQGGVPAVPSLLSLSMLVMIDILQGPVNELKLRIKSPEEETIFEQTLDLNSIPLPIDESANTMTLAMNLQNLIIRSLGKYVFEFYVNGEIDTEKELNVIRKEF